MTFNPNRPFKKGGSKNIPNASKEFFIKISVLTHSVGMLAQTWIFEPQPPEIARVLLKKNRYAI
ncbi:MAG: hypothetical protein U1F46_15500 [Marinagarivorans sp.]